MSNLKFIDTTLNITLGEMTQNYRTLEGRIREGEAAQRGYNQTRSELDGARTARKKDAANLQRHEEAMVSATLRLMAAREPLYACLKHVVGWLQQDRGWQLDGAPAHPDAHDRSSWRYTGWVERNVTHNNFICMMDLVERGIELFTTLPTPTLDRAHEELLGGLTGESGAKFYALPDGLPWRSNAETRTVSDLVMQMLALGLSSSGAVTVPTDGVDDQLVTAAKEHLQKKGWRVEAALPQPGSGTNRAVKLRKPRRKPIAKE